MRIELTGLLAFSYRAKSWGSLACGSTSEEDEEQAASPTFKAPSAVHWANAPPTRLGDPRVKAVALVGPERVYVPPCPFCGQ